MQDRPNNNIDLRTALSEKNKFVHHAGSSLSI